MKKNHCTRLFIPLAVSIATLLPSAYAGTIWDGGGADDLWGTGANWDDNVSPTPTIVTDLTFDGVTRLTPNNNYGAFDDFHSIFFAAGAGAFTLSGSAIDLFGKIENYSTATQTVAFDLAINAGQPGTGEFNPINGDLLINSANVFTNGNTLRVYGVNNRSVTFGAGTVISQAGDFNVEQASNVVFLGNNTYTGTTNVLAGSLTVGGGGTTGALGAGTVTVAAGATLTYNRSDAVTLGQMLNIGGALVKNGADALTISGAQAGITGTVAINAGRITMGANDSLGTAAVTLNGGTIERNVGNITVGNAIAVGAGGGTILGRQVVDAYANFSGQLTGSGALTVQGLVQLSNNTNTYNGALTISSAPATYLRLAASEVLGDATSVNLAVGNSFLRLDGGVTETIGVLSGAGSIFSSNVGGVLNANLRVGAGDVSSTYSGTITNNDGILTLTKIGSGTLSLGLAGGTFSGLNISQGAVSSTNGNLGTNSTVTLGDANTGASNVSFTTTGSGVGRPIVVSASGTGTATIGTTAGAGNASFGGQITLNRPTTITAGSTDRTTYTGKITGNVGTLTISGGRRTVFDNAANVNDFVGDVVVTGTGTILQTGVATGTGENIPNASNLTVGTGAIVKFANTANSTETINALNGSGTVQRHEAVGGLATLVIGSANGFGGYDGNFLNGAGTLALVKSGSGTQLLNRVGGNNGALGGVTVNGGTLALVHTTDNFDRGYFTGTTPLTINAGGTLDATRLWTIKSTNVVNINGGTLNFSSPFVANISDTNYVNNLTLQNGATISGSGGFRVGNVAGPTLTMTSTGNTTNTISTNLYFVKLSGITTYSMDVADGTAAVDLDISGNVFDSSSFPGMVLNKAGAGNLRLSGTNTFVGATTISAGTLTLGAGGTTGSLAGAITNDSELAINRSGTVTMANAISGIGSLAHNGSSATTLTGALSYTGATTVNAGTLITSPTQTGATSVAVADGATFGVKLASAGTTFSAVSLTTGATTGATLLFDTGALGNPTAAVIDAANFTPTAATTLKVLGTGLTPGTFPLLNYSGAIGGTDFAGLSLSLPFRVSGILVDNPESVDVTVNGVETVKWQGNVPGGAWDIDPDGGNTAGTINWKTSVLSAPTRYAQGAVNTDTVTFDDSATGTTNVNLTTTLTPVSLTVNNTALNYFFRGTGSISGTTGLTKEGDGALVIVNTTANDYTGGTTISGGVLQLGDGVTPGAGVIGGPITNNGTLTFYRPEDTTANNVISGFGAVLQVGPGRVTFSGNNSYSGGTNIRGGTMEGLTNGAFGSGEITLGDIGTGADNVALYLGNRADVTNAVTVSALGTGTATLGANNTGSGANAASFFGTVTLNRPTTFSGEVAADRLTFDGRITGPVGTLVVTGGSRVTFANTANDFVGEILIVGADSILQSSVATAAEVIPDATDITVGPGAVLQLASSSGAETINALNGAGTVRTFLNGTFGSRLAVGSAGGSGIFTGTLVNGTAGNPLSLTKLGAGTQTLTGVNTYSGGTTISGGILKVNSDAALGALAAGLTIENNATLQASGPLSTAARTLTLGAGGGTIDTNGNDVTYDLGSSITGAETLTKVGVGKLTIVALQTYATLTAEDGRTDLASPLGTGTSTLNANADVNIGVSQTLAALNIGAGAVVTFGAPLPPAPALDAGSDLAAAGVQAVPEPGSLALVFGGMLALLGRRRRSR